MAEPPPTESNATTLSPWLKPVEKWDILNPDNYQEDGSCDMFLQRLVDENKGKFDLQESAFDSPDVKLFSNMICKSATHTTNIIESVGQLIKALLDRALQIPGLIHTNNMLWRRGELLRKLLEHYGNLSSKLQEEQRILLNQLAFVASRVQILLNALHISYDPASGKLFKMDLMDPTIKTAVERTDRDLLGVDPRLGQLLDVLMSLVSGEMYGQKLTVTFNPRMALTFKKADFYTFNDDEQLQLKNEFVTLLLATMAQEGLDVSKFSREWFIRNITLYDGSLVLSVILDDAATEAIRSLGDDSTNDMVRKTQLAFFKLGFDPMDIVFGMPQPLPLIQGLYSKEWEDSNSLPVFSMPGPFPSSIMDTETELLVQHLVSTPGSRQDAVYANRAKGKDMQAILAATMYNRALESTANLQLPDTVTKDELVNVLVKMLMGKEGVKALISEEELKAKLVKAVYNSQYAQYYAHYGQYYYANLTNVNLVAIQALISELAKKASKPPVMVDVNLEALAKELKLQPSDILVQKLPGKDEFQSFAADVPYFKEKVQEWNDRVAATKEINAATNDALEAKRAAQAKAAADKSEQTKQAAEARAAAAAQEAKRQDEAAARAAERKAQAEAEAEAQAQARAAAEAEAKAAAAASAEAKAKADAEAKAAAAEAKAKADAEAEAKAKVEAEAKAKAEAEAKAEAVATDSFNAQPTAGGVFVAGGDNGAQAGALGKVLTLQEQQELEQNRKKTAELLAAQSCVKEFVRIRPFLKGIDTRATQLQLSILKDNKATFKDTIDVLQQIKSNMVTESYCIDFSKVFNPDEPAGDDETAKHLKELNAAYKQFNITSPGVDKLKCGVNGFIFNDPMEYAQYAANNKDKLISAFVDPKTRNDAEKKLSGDIDSAFMSQIEGLLKSFFEQDKNVMTMFYGASGSGKTYISQTILDWLFTQIDSEMTNNRSVNFEISVVSDYNNKLYDYYSNTANMTLDMEKIPSLTAKGNRKEYNTLRDMINSLKSITDSEKENATYFYFKHQRYCSGLRAEQNPAKQNLFYEGNTTYAVKPVKNPETSKPTFFFQKVKYRGEKLFKTDLENRIKLFRSVNDTGLNAESSRSHLAINIFRIKPGKSVQTFSIVDLAGTEDLNYLLDKEARIFCNFQDTSADWGTQPIIDLSKILPKNKAIIFGSGWRLVKSKSVAIDMLAGFTEATSYISDKGTGYSGSMKYPYKSTGDESTSISIKFDDLATKYVSASNEAAMIAIEQEYALIVESYLPNIQPEIKQKVTETINNTISRFQLESFNIKPDVVAKSVLGMWAETKHIDKSLEQIRTLLRDKKASVGRQEITFKPVAQKDNLYPCLDGSCAFVTKVLLPTIESKSSVVVVGALNPRRSDDYNSYRTMTNITESFSDICPTAPTKCAE